MALRKPASQTTPAFESEDGAAPAADTPSSASAGEANTAVTKPAPTAVATVGAFSDVFKQFHNALPVSIGDTLRLKTGSGVIRDENALNYGAWIKLELMSWQEFWTISPGDDSAEAKETVRYSADGVTIDSTGESVDEYVEFLRTEGYDDARKKKYTLVVGYLEAADKPVDTVGQVVSVSLSPKSAELFNRFRLNKSVRLARGVDKPEAVGTLFIRVRSESKNGKDYTLLETTDKI